MARATLTLPVKANSHPYFVDMVFCPFCGRTMHKDAKTCGNYCDWENVFDAAFDAVLDDDPVDSVDLRPKGALAYAL